MNDYEENKKEYAELVKKASPNSPLWSNCIKAFVVGGGICVIGQLLTNAFLGKGMSQEDAALSTSIILILGSAVLTGFGLYGRFGSFSGAGTIVPITGFANSVVSPAIEFKKEGFILGLGAKIFVVAGPVILYGVLTSMAVGLIYYLAEVL